MRGFAVWVTDRPYRIVLLAIVFVQIFVPVAAALLVLDALRRGPAAAMLSAVLTIAGTVLIGLSLEAGMIAVLSVAAPVLLIGAAGGALLRASQSLSFAFQATVMGSIAFALIVLVAAPEARGIGELVLGEFLLLLELGGLTEAQLAPMAETDPARFGRYFLFSLHASQLAGLMLGAWWYALIAKGVPFGAEFRALRLGRVTGIALMVPVTAALVIASELVRLVAAMAVAGFLFQGLAVLHARSRSDNWHVAVLVLVYLALVPPLTGITILGVSAIGLLDCVFPLRKRAEA